MIIDFHTHIFPDALAERAIENLKKSGNIVNAIGGRSADLLSEMKGSGVTLSVVLPILTHPRHFASMTDFACRINSGSDGLLSFGAVHPDMDEPLSKIRELKDKGFKGVKLHPLFQNYDIDSIESERLIGLLCDEDMIISIHSGYDISFPNASNAVPDKLVNMLKAVKPQKTVLAHMGAASYWEESLKKLACFDVYFDTSFSLDEMSSELFVKLVSAKGEDRVLFGSDSPWKSQSDYVKRLNALPISDEAKEKILYRNAKKLLGV